MNQPTCEEQYYVHRKGSFLGNAPMWWAKGGNGYTAYILGAERFSKKDAEDLLKEDRTKWAIYKCCDVDKRLHLVYDSQDNKRLGTDEPCAWPSGYAPNYEELKQQRDELIAILRRYMELEDATHQMFDLIAEGTPAAKLKIQLLKARTNLTGEIIGAIAKVTK